MTIAESVVSGIVQGLTEFLPVSSSGHLVLVHSFFGFSEPAVFFDICLHIATLAAVVIYFWKDIFALKWIWYIILATIPAGAAGVLFEDSISAFFTSPKRVAVMFIVTSGILLAGQFCLWKKSSTAKSLTWGKALFVGVMQAFALFPGVSRSGTTVSAALVSGVKAEESFRFSFLLSVPIVFAAAAYKCLKLGNGFFAEVNVGPYLLGMISAFLVGLLGLKILWWIIEKKRLYVFALYCFILGAIIWIR